MHAIKAPDCRVVRTGVSGTWNVLWWYWESWVRTPVGLNFGCVFQAFRLSYVKVKYLLDSPDSLSLFFRLNLLSWQGGCQLLICPRGTHYGWVARDSGNGNGKLAWHFCTWLVQQSDPRGFLFQIQRPIYLAIVVHRVICFYTLCLCLDMFFTQ